MKHTLTLLTLLLLTSLTASAAEPAMPAAAERGQDASPNRMFQYFVSSGEPDRPNLGAYLWVPPNMPHLRALMVAMHNGLPINILQSEPFMDARGVPETRFTLRLIRHRLTPGAGFNMSFVRVYPEGDAAFAAAGRTCQISLVPADAAKNASAQTLDFPAVPDAPAASPRIELKARSSAGLPVDYFVFKGQGIIRDSAFIPTEVPSGATTPLEVTIGAYQVGLFKGLGGIKPAETLYQTFHLTP